MSCRFFSSGHCKSESVKTNKLSLFSSGRCESESVKTNELSLFSSGHCESESVKTNELQEAEKLILEGWHQPLGWD